MTTRARTSAEPPPAPSFPWERWGVPIGLVLNLMLAAAAFATNKADIANLRAEVPPGSIQLLTERTEQIQKTLDRLAAKP